MLKETRSCRLWRILFSGGAAKEKTGNVQNRKVLYKKEEAAGLGKKACT